MAWKSIVAGLVVSAVCCSLASCTLNFRRVDAPPKDHDGAARWWLETSDVVPADLLAVYVAAADAHLERHSSAIYVQTRYQTTMLSRNRFELRLPCPPPPDILARLRKRVRPGDVDRDWSADLVYVRTKKCVGCSTEEAERIWQDAIKTARAAVAGKRDTANQPAPPLKAGEVNEPGR